MAAMKPFDEAPLNPYEQQRAERIARNQKVLGKQRVIHCCTSQMLHIPFAFEVRPGLHRYSSIPQLIPIFWLLSPQHRRESSLRKSLND